MKQVNCTKCGVSFDIQDNHFRLSKKRNQTNFYCSKKCKKTPIEQVFADKTIKNGDCIEWIGAKYPFGYGVVEHNGIRISTHRLSWILNNGEIPEGMCICHKCDNPPCVNPEHLFLGTQSDNMKDAYKKGRLNINNITFPIGHTPFNRTLKTKDEINLVKKAILEKSVSLKKLAIQLNLPYQLIKDINCGRVYK